MKKKKKKSLVGRPTLYKPEYAHLIKFMKDKDGLTIERVAEIFKVNRSTIREWIDNHPEFSASLNETKEEIDNNVEKSLFQRANGFTKKIMKIKVLPNGQKEQIVEEKYFPPDPTAMIFWLKNRQPKTWRDRQEIEFDASDSTKKVFAFDLTKKPE